MSVDYLLQVAQDYYARARATANPAAKSTLIQIGDTYLNEAEKLKRGAVKTQVTAAR